MGHYADSSKFSCDRTELENMGNMYAAAQVLAAALDYDMPAAETQIVKTRIEVKNDIAEALLKGKVEAYENILMGRGLTVTP